MIEVTGHANYRRKGKDIVCSAVSSIIQTAVLGLMKVLCAEIDYTVDEKEGYLRCMLYNPNEKTEIVLQTMLEGLKDISSEFPKHVKLMEV